MKPEDQRAILDLVTYPGSAPRKTPEEVLRHFGTDDGRAWGWNCSGRQSPNGTVVRWRWP